MGNDLIFLINSAITNCKKYKMSTHLSLCLSFKNNPKIIEYESEKKEYKISDDKVNKGKEIIDYFVKILDAHKEIEYLEDPLDKSDKEMYSLLNAECNDKNVMVIGNGLYSSQIAEIENGIESNWTSGACVSCLDIFTISNALRVSNMDIELMLTDDCNSEYSVDLSVVCNASMLRLSLPNCGKSMNSYNRWLMIADELLPFQEYDDELEDENNAKNANQEEEEDEIEILDKDEDNEDGDVEKEEDLP